MSLRNITRLLDLLGLLSEQEWVDGVARDQIAALRTLLHDELDRKEAEARR